MEASCAIVGSTLPPLPEPVPLLLLPLDPPELFDDDY